MPTLRSLEACLTDGLRTAAIKEIRESGVALMGAERKRFARTFDVYRQLVEEPRVPDVTSSHQKVKGSLHAGSSAPR